LLTGRPVGSYLVRLSAGRPGDYVLAVKKPPTGEAVQIIVQYQPASLTQRTSGSFLLDGVTYSSIADIRARNSELLKEPLPLYSTRHLLQCIPLSDAARREALQQQAVRRISQRSMRGYNQGFGGSGGGGSANAYNFSIDDDNASSHQTAAMAYGSIRHSGDAADHYYQESSSPSVAPNRATFGANTAALAYGATMDSFAPAANSSASSGSDQYVLPLANDTNYLITASADAPLRSSTTAGTQPTVAPGTPQSSNATTPGRSITHCCDIDRPILILLFALGCCLGLLFGVVGTAHHTR
jgi:hypothetical protein